MMLKAVVLPAPLGPMTPTISHSPTKMLTSEFARTPPNVIDALTTSSTDIGHQYLSQAAILRVEALADQPLRDRTDLLPDAAGEDRERQEQQQGAEDEGRSTGRQLGKAGDIAQGGLDARDVLDEIPRECEERRPDHNARAALQTADHRHDHKDQRELEVEADARHLRVIVGQQRSAEPGEHTGQHEREQRVHRDVDAERRRDARVLPQREERASALGLHQASIDPQHDGQDGDTQIEVAVLALEAARPRGILSGRAAGQRLDLEQRFLREEPVRQRDEREVQTAHAERNETEHGGLRAPDEHRDNHRDQKGLFGLRNHVRGGERADTDERLVAEGDLSRVADKDVQRKADDRVGDRLREEGDVGGRLTGREPEDERADRSHDDAARDPAERRRTEAFGAGNRLLDRAEALGGVGGGLIGGKDLAAALDANVALIGRRHFLIVELPLDLFLADLLRPGGSRSRRFALRRLALGRLAARRSLSSRGLAHDAFPRIPCGRATSTTSRMMKTTNVSGAGMLENTDAFSAMLSATPMAAPPRNAPGRLVMPPRMAAVKAGMSTLSVIKPGPNVPEIGALRMPASPPRSAAMPQVKAASRLVEIPTSSVAV